MQHQSWKSGIPLGIALAGTTLSALGQVTNESQKLIPSDPVLARQLGQSVAMDDGVIAVGCLLGYNTGDVAGVQSGSVYLYSASTGVQYARLYASDAAVSDHFGFSVDIDNGIVAIGARSDDDNGSNSGSAYLFNSSTGAQIRKLLPPNGGAGQEFGYSIAIDDGIVAVGARLDNDNGTSSGSVYLFDASTGVFLRKVLPTVGATGDRFGTSIAMDSGVLAVGAPGADAVVGGDGAAYLFEVSSGAQLHTLLASDAGLNDLLGNAISIDNGLVVVGAQWDDGIGTNSGSAYVFDANSGMQIMKLLPDDAGMNREFGSSVAISGGVAVIGSNLDGGISSTGDGAYFFDAMSGTQLARLVASDATAGDGFGFAVAIDGNGAAVTSNHDQVGIYTDRGSAYVFAVPAACLADLNNDGQLDFLDISAFLMAYNAMDPAADLNNDMQFDFLDISAFLGSYNAGCP